MNNWQNLIWLGIGMLAIAAIVFGPYSFDTEISDPTLSVVPQSQVGEVELITKGKKRGKLRIHNKPGIKTKLQRIRNQTNNGGKSILKRRLLKGPANENVQLEKNLEPERAAQLEELRNQSQNGQVEAGVATDLTPAKADSENSTFEQRGENILPNEAPPNAE